jgi:hypothetical protein
VRRAGGEFLVEDLNSKNGTYINDRKVVSSSRIGNGDRVAFGDVVLTAEVRSNPRSASATELPGVTRPYSDNAPSPGATLVYPDASTPPVRSIGAGPEVSTPTPQPGLAVDGLAALHRLEQDLSTALVQFEHNGGRETLSAILDRLARLEGRRAGQELEALSNWIPTIRTMLEIELRLFNAMGGSSSAGSAQRPRDELQSHTGQIERVSRS